MNNVDIGLFDYDRHNAVYYFAMNADERIYLRYGGRDETSPETYLNLDSFERALEAGLREHARYRRGTLPKRERPAPLYPRDIELVRSEVLAMGRCVECHLIADYQLLQRELDGTLDKRRDMFVYPDIKRIGIHLDVPTGLGVKETAGPAALAGMRPGDYILALNGEPVLTFGDVQYLYNKVPRDSKEATFTVRRGDTAQEVRVDLPGDWWYTDLYHRYWSVDPQAYFYVRGLTFEEKERLGFRTDGFASVVTGVDTGAQVYNLHDLEERDIIYAVNGVEADGSTQNLDLYIKLNIQGGDDFRVKILRGRQPMELRIRTHRENFRKPKF